MNRQVDRSTKRTHRLTPQTSVLWIQAARGYLARFSMGNYSVVDSADQAQLFDEERASATAMNFKKLTGLSAAVRPYYSLQ